MIAAARGYGADIAPILSSWDRSLVKIAGRFIFVTFSKSVWLKYLSTVEILFSEQFLLGDNFEHCCRVHSTAGAVPHDS